MGYRNWTSTFKWEEIEGIEYIHAGQLFIHQMSHLWLDFQGIRDDVNRKYKIDYFENFPPRRISSAAICCEEPYEI